MNEREQKERFTLAWLSDPTNPYKAAQAVFGTNVGMCAQASVSWIHDPEVLEIRDALIVKHGERAFLPTKDKAAREVYEAAQSAKSAGNFRDFKSLMELYADMLGFIEKPGTQVNVGVTVPSVMLIKDQGNNDSWEERLKKNQDHLTSNVTVN